MTAERFVRSIVTPLIMCALMLTATSGVCRAQTAPPPAPQPPPSAPDQPPPPTTEAPPSAATTPPPPPPGYGTQPPPQQPGAQPLPPPQGYGYGYGYGAPTYQEPAPRHSPGLMIGGLAAFGAPYVISLSAGAILLSSSCHNCGPIGGAMIVPVVGPWVALGIETLPVFAVLGVVQTAGFALMVGGILRYRRSKERRRQWLEDHPTAFELKEGRYVTADAGVGPGGGGLRLGLHF